MGLVRFDDDLDNVVSDFSQGRGPVLRSDHLEVTKIFFAKGEGADMHQHKEEQLTYILSGRLLVKLEDQEYEIGPGEATFNPANVRHSVQAIEDTYGLSVKNLVDPAYGPTGRLA